MSDTHDGWKSQKSDIVNIASVASYVYIMSERKFIKNAKNSQFWWDKNCRKKMKTLKNYNDNVLTCTYKCREIKFARCRLVVLTPKKLHKELQYFTWCKWSEMHYKATSRKKCNDLTDKIKKDHSFCKCPFYNMSLFNNR